MESVKEDGVKYGWSAQPGPMKWLSYHGAVRVRKSDLAYLAPNDLFIDPEQLGYFDAGNEVYSYLLDTLWPGCLRTLSNRSTKGDVMEAMLGYAYLKRHISNARWSDRQKWIIADLDCVCWYTFTHWSQFGGSR